MLPLHNEQLKQKYTNLCFNRYYETPSYCTSLVSALPPEI